MPPDPARIEQVEGMTMKAVGCSSVLPSESISATLIFCVRHGFHVGRVYTPGVSTEVIDLKAYGDRAVPIFPSHPIGESRAMAFKVDATVTLTIPVSLPGPTAIRTA
jgi:hypothetical protein